MMTKSKRLMFYALNALKCSREESTQIHNMLAGSDCASVLNEQDATEYAQALLQKVRTNDDKE